MSSNSKTAVLSDQATDTALRLANITQVFYKDNEQLVALHDVSLDIAPGEFVSLVGPSGCGKSTLLKIVAGLMRSTLGKVYFEGTPVTEPRQDIGFMFQSPTLFPWRTVVKNISLPLEITRKDDPDWEKRIAEVIDLVRLNGFEQHLPRELSGGMQQRVALCRLLVSDPHLMLLDEPFGSLDEFTRERLNGELARIAEHENKTTVFVTHNIPEAVFLADRVAVMGTQPGRILEVVPSPIPRPRVLSSRSSPEFTDTVNHIRKVLGLA